MTYFPPGDCCVYAHVDNRSNEVVYVGQGTYARPYSLARNKRHQQWLIAHTKRFGVGAHVKILHQHVSKRTALALEDKLIRKLRPRFNGAIGPSQEEILKMAECLRRPQFTQRQRDAWAQDYLAGEHPDDFKEKLVRLINVPIS